MSETKFNVGQWVTVHGGVNRIEEVGLHHVRLDDGFSINLEHVKPFVWQVGKTYKTTLDGVTATIQANTNKALYGQDSRPDSVSWEWAWDECTGLLRGIEKAEAAPHLLPCLADEPQPMPDAETFSEFEEADECDEPSPLESLLEEFKLERKSCESRVATWEARAAAWRQAEQAVIDRIERAKR